MSDKIPDAIDPSSGAVSITFKFDWRTIVRIGLVWAAEYAMLALIEDAPAVLKIGTLVCALAGLGILQFEDQILKKGRRVFLAAVGAASAVYLGLSAYAINHYLNRQELRARMAEMYVTGGKIIDREIPVVSFDKYDETSVKKFIEDGLRWEKTTGDWLLANLGDTARERFGDMFSVGTYCLGQANGSYACDSRYDRLKNRLVAEKKNLSAIIETSAYEP